MKTIILNCTLNGYLRYGHYEAELTSEEYEEFSQLDEDAKKKYAQRKGNLILDDYRVNDVIIDDIDEVE